MFKDRERYINDLLDSNYSPENFKILLEEFGSHLVLGVANCSNKILNLIPNFKQSLNSDKYRNIPVSFIDLTKNNFSIINPKSFLDSPLKSIDLSINKINKISHNALNGVLNSLVSLKLNHNQLTTLTTFPIYFASKLSNLKALFLASNKLEIVLNRSFQSIFSAWLKILDLSSNSIHCVYEDGFVGLYSLEYLNLCNNKLGQEIEKSDKCNAGNVVLNILMHLKSIQNVQLCSNSIEIINDSANIFRESSKLKVINFENNKIKSLKNLFCLNDAQFLKVNGNF